MEATHIGWIVETCRALCDFCIACSHCMNILYWEMVKGLHKILVGGQISYCTMYVGTYCPGHSSFFCCLNKSYCANAKRQLLVCIIYRINSRELVACIGGQKVLPSVLINIFSYLLKHLCLWIYFLLLKLQVTHGQSYLHLPAESTRYAEQLFYDASFNFCCLASKCETDYFTIFVLKLRVHCAEVLGTPIVGDYKYGWQAHRKLKHLSSSTSIVNLGARILEQEADPFSLRLGNGSISDKQPHLHLHCKEMVLPNFSLALQQARVVSGADLVHVESIKLVAPLPSHMQKSWDCLSS